MKTEDKTKETAARSPYQRENELLEKVWKRVAPEKTAAKDGREPPPGALPAPGAAEQPAAEPSCDLAGQRKEKPPSGPAPKPAAPGWEKQIMAFIADEHADAQYYRKMARCYQTCGNVFSAMCADEQRHAKRLSAILFLRACIRIPVCRQKRPLPLPDYCDALRVRILEERKGAAAYQAAGENEKDETLRQVYLELAQEEREHARALQKLLERAI
ncbi:MAG: hypothetical protein ACOX0U_06460 [Oscillospiraceae bacterium]|jgi:hypothetical protein